MSEKNFTEQDQKDIDALDKAGYDTSDVGRGNKAMSESDVAKETDTTSSKAAEAGHQARDDMAEAGDMGVPSDRHGESERDGEDESDGEAESDGDAGDDGGDDGGDGE